MSAHEGGRRDVEQEDGLPQITWPDGVNGALLLKSGASLALGLDEHGQPVVTLSHPDAVIGELSTTLREAELRALLVLAWATWSRFQTRRDRAAHARTRARHAPSPGER
jgi:hypothetical protein